MFRNYTASTNTGLVVTSTKLSTNISGSGNVPVGLKVLVVSKDSGSPATMTVANSLVGPDGESAGTLTWTRAFAANDYLDWRYTDPGDVTWNAGSVNATGFVQLWPWGTNVVELTLDSGQVTVTLSYKWAWL
jgi:hypothetical protein